MIGAGLMAYNQYLYQNLIGWCNQGSCALRFVPRNIAF
jgi:hypothetical protein